MSEYVVRPAEPRDRAQVVAIVTEMWRSDVTKRFAWLYDGNPHGGALTWVVAETSGAEELVAVTSLFPRHLVVQARQRTGSIGGDCMVLPRARRKGLATKLHRASFAGMRARGVELMYGPPRPNNLQALLKAGSNDVTMFRRWTRPLTGDAAMQAAARTRPALTHLAPLASAAMTALDRAMAPNVEGWSLERATRFGPEHTRVMDAVARTHRVFPVRDATWLDWRWLRGPYGAQRAYDVKRRGELVGFVALEKEPNGARGVIVDVAVPADREHLGPTVELILREARAMGCDALDASFTPGSPVVEALAWRGFLGREEHGFQVALATGVDDPMNAELLDARAWTFTDGDKDMDTAFSPEPEG